MKSEVINTLVAMLRAGRILPRIILLTSFVLAIGIAYWGLAFNRGYIVASSDIRPFVIDGMYDTPTKCEQAACKYEVKPKAYNLVISADGYTSQSLSVGVSRSKEAQITYTPETIPSIEQVKTPNVVSELFYISKRQGQKTEIWQRDSLSDQLIVSYESNDLPRRLIEDPYSRYLLIENASGSFIAVDLTQKNKKIIDLPESWTEVGLLGKDWIIWQEDNNVYYSPFAEPGKDATNLHTNSIGQAISNTPTSALFLSQVPLAGARPSNQTDSSFLDIVSFTDENNEINLNQRYFLYKIDLVSGHTTYLKELEWTEKNQLKLEHNYDEQTLEAKMFLNVDKDLYEIVSR